MVYIPEIQYTKDYDSFKLIKKNRPISPVHVQSFIEDKTFPDKFPTAAIVVDKDKYIIDGQHRWSAAKELGIPVYYIVDPAATHDDIRIRNKKNKQWDTNHYIHYFADENDDYKIVKDLRNRFEIPLTFLHAAILKLCNYKIREIGYVIKDGKLDLEGKGKLLINFVEQLVPCLKKHRQCYVGEDAYPLFNQAYAVGFMTFFLEDKSLFKRILTKLKTTDVEPPITSKFEKAREVLRKIGYTNASENKSKKSKDSEEC